MTLFILTETSAGYAILKSKDKKLLKRDDIAEQTETAEGAASLFKLKHFSKFDSASAALAEAAALTEGKVTPTLSKLLDEIKEEKKASLAVADPKLANAINKLPQLQIVPVSDKSTEDVFRAIRAHLPSLIPQLLPEELATMSLGLSHSLSRHKLKFSPDKVDTMIIQAIALLDDLDKELNTYAMRVKEWYGWHFPEMAKIINDNLAYAKVILSMGVRSNAATADLSDILPEEIEGAVKAAAEISMGTEITDEDLMNIQALAEQVVGFTEYRSQLSSYLSSRMQAIAPNLTALVGDLVGARLIAHSGSLMNLAKSPASTIQILGAEKALFRALKTKHDTPKYGLIYHASLIGQATGKNKGKIARVLATKAALGLRVDALSDWGTGGENEKPEPSEEEKMAVGVNGRLMVERRLRHLEGKPLKREGVAIGPGGQQTQPNKWSIKEARKYNADADGLAADEPAAKVVNGKSKSLITEIKEDVDMKDDSDEESADEGAQVNGNGDLSKEERKALKQAKKEAKAQRKLEKAEKRAAKEAKRAAKEAGSTGLTNGDSKKRKHDDVEGDATEKKKKKKKSKDA
ncbi:Nucleolar protein 58 [Sphaceloma murrayae]|uniref:Nucleolar protein 58 n=1 Tax=Sphaceloma murrayae TaxID=2082308 RepID=A0A2K1QIH2_9PEZI|nr:Nucleolar protein 58 [Sphaceloma murrayae]